MTCGTKDIESHLGGGPGNAALLRRNRLAQGLEGREGNSWNRIP